MRARLWLATSVLIAGCGLGDHEERAFGCERGFRPSDWRAERLTTAQSVEKCGWLKGWSDGRLLRALGPPASRDGRFLTWSAGASDRGMGPMGWDLVIEENAARGVVKRATTELRNI